MQDDPAVKYDLSGQPQRWVVCIRLAGRQVGDNLHRLARQGDAATPLGGGLCAVASLGDRGAGGGCDDHPPAPALSS